MSTIRRLIDADRLSAHCETYFQAFHSIPRTRGGASDLFVGGRYVDRFEKRNGEWRVAHRTLVFGDVVAEPMKEASRFPPEFAVQKHGMDDPLYLLARK